MRSPDKPSSNPEDPLPGRDGIEFEQAFEEVEALLQSLKDRYIQIQTAKQQKTELQQTLQQLQGELHRVKNQLEELEVNLESRLLTWSSQREVFWQIVRFVGLGLVVGLALKSCTA